MRLAVAALVMSALLGSNVAPADDDGTFVVVVGADNPVPSPSGELARLFLKKTSRWSDGREVRPVDQSADRPCAARSRAVLSVEGMGKISAVQSFWLQQVYSGQSTPPPVKPADAEVIAYITANPGAIWYVGAAPAAGTVKVLAIKD
jgi:ABC-type phosphate transport system substrate-binding protein